MSLRAQLGKVILLGMLFVAFPASAHHVFSAEYDAEKSVKLRGTLTKVNWVNPHSWVYLEVKDDSGKVVIWTLEFGSPNQLTRRGFKKADLAIGLVVDVFGYLHKNKPEVAIAHNVKFPDGREFYVGGDGTGSPDPKAGTDASKPAQ